MSEEPKEGDLAEIAFPEVFPGATRWAHSDKPMYSQGIVCVSEDGLRSLLRLLRDAQRYLICEMTKGTSAEDLFAEEGKALFPKVFNALSRVWCEQDLVVSGLFVHGMPLLNPCVEEAVKKAGGEDE